MKNIYTILVRHYSPIELCISDLSCNDLCVKSSLFLFLRQSIKWEHDSATKKYGPVVNESVTNCHDLMLASSLKNADNIVQVSFSGMCIQRL